MATMQPGFSLPKMSAENAARLVAAFEGRQAIYVEKGILKVRIDGITADLTKRAVSAHVTELPTRGMPYHGQGGLASPIRFEIAGGYLTSFSAYQWSMGYGGFTLYFDTAVIASVTALGASLPRDMDWNERYKQMLDCLDPERTWAQHTRVFE